MRLLETKMEDCGHLQLAQIIRWQMFCALDSDEQQAIREWSQQAIEVYFDARRIIQREMYLYEVSERLEHADCATRVPQLIAYDQEIEELDTRYWENQRLTWKLEGNLPLGFMTKAFKQCRANMDWYLCSWMRQASHTRELWEWGGAYVESIGIIGQGSYQPVYSSYSEWSDYNEALLLYVLSKLLFFFF